MANPEHVEILEKGVKAWNNWRRVNPDVQPDLSGADLMWAAFKGANLGGVNLRGANLRGADLCRVKFSEADLNGAVLSKADLMEADLNGANLSKADLREVTLNGANLGGANLGGANLNGANLNGANFCRANLSGANLSWANLGGVNLREADLSKANLRGADLTDADLHEANLSGANLTEALLIKVNLSATNLSDCRIYGVSAWDLNLEWATQRNLIITADGEPIITVDNLEVAQFIYVLLNNEKIRDIIDTITTKVVLILGRFTFERKPVLDAIREELRHHNYIPVLFDFDKPASRDLTETITTLARMSRFIIADFTEPRSLPHEMASVVPDLRSVPIQPILLETQTEYGMWEDFKVYPWVLATFKYSSLEHLLESLAEHVIDPAEKKAKELTARD